MRNIPLSCPEIGEEEKNAVCKVLDSGWLTHGAKTREFEEIFSEYLGVKHAVAMNSCTSALFLVLLANDIRGEVILPSMTFVASANAVLTAGATPRFCEVERSSCNASAKTIEPLINSRTEAVMVIHYAGQCCAMDEIKNLCAKHNLLLIEDSAQTIGGKYRGNYSGSWGSACWSFFPTKNITTGEGGMLTTNDIQLSDKVRCLVGHGIKATNKERRGLEQPWKREAMLPGFNFRMSNILAAIGIEQMKKLDLLNQQRRALSQQMIEELRDCELIQLPTEESETFHVYQMFTIKVDKKQRDSCVNYLRSYGISASVHFDPPVHLQSCYKEYATNPLLVTENLAKELVTIPNYPSMTSSDATYISDTLKAWLRNL
jgi:perosamine synthetase